MRKIVIVGASLAGVSAAEELRERGYDGELLLVGAEQHLPYDRPPLSKAVLAGEAIFEACLLRPESVYEELEVELALGSRARSLDLHERRITLENERSYGFDGLVIATGATPIELPGPRLEGVHTLRTIDDAEAIESCLADVANLTVIGGGFIGAEVAATVRSRGIAVTLIEGLPSLMSRVVGAPVGNLFAELHREHGVEVRCGTPVAGLLGDRKVRAVQLADGAVIPADVVVVGIGVRPSTGWLESSGLALENGVLTDAYLSTAAAGIAAAGDVARWSHPVLGLVRIEHWDNAVHQGHAAARALTSREGPYLTVPYVWSDQYDRKIQVVGFPRGDDETVVVNGSLQQRRFLVLYGRNGMLSGGLAVNRSRLIRDVRRMLAEPTTLADAVQSFVNRESSRSAPA